MILANKEAREFLAICTGYWPAYASFFEELMLAKLGIDVTIQKHKARRTIPQNSLYWVVVGALADHAGYTKNEMHEEILCEQFGFDLVEWRGIVKKRPKKRSSGLNTEDFGALIDIAQRWAAEEGVLF